MFDCFLAQMLVLIMLFFCSVRIFFLKHSRVDCFAAFSPVALITSIFNFICFNFSMLNLAIFLLALLVFFTNFRAVLRLQTKLIVDGYSAVFIIFSIFSILLTIALAALIIYMRPVRYSAKDFSITKKEFVLTGNTGNLHIRESFFSGERFSGNLFLYEPQIHDEITEEIYSKNPVLIFSPGIKACVQNYEPYLMLLAQKGYTVLAADLYTDDTKVLARTTENKSLSILLDSKFLRKNMALHLERKNRDMLENLLLETQSFATKKYSALTRIALEVFGDDIKTFYIVDGVDFDSIYAVIDEFNTEPYSNAKGFFSMNRVDEYKTNGYGFIEQTDVLLAHTKGIERENKFFIPRYVANKTIKAIEEQK